MCSYYWTIEHLVCCWSFFCTLQLGQNRKFPLYGLMKFCVHFHSHAKATRVVCLWICFWDFVDYGTRMHTNTSVHSAKAKQKIIAFESYGGKGFQSNGMRHFFCSLFTCCLFVKCCCIVCGIDISFSLSVSSERMVWLYISFRAIFCKYI